MRQVKITSVQDLPRGYVAEGTEMDGDRPLAHVSFAVAPSFAKKLLGCVARGEQVSGQVDDAKFLKRQLLGEEESAANG